LGLERERVDIPLHSLFCRAQHAPNDDPWRELFGCTLRVVNPCLLHDLGYRDIWNFDPSLLHSSFAQEVKEREFSVGQIREGQEAWSSLPTGAAPERSGVQHSLIVLKQAMPLIKIDFIARFDRKTKAPRFLRNMGHPNSPHRAKLVPLAKLITGN
jgi:hypothetical protein